jgi:uncharacterized repeat protein (TIGR01451 family)
MRRSVGLSAPASSKNHTLSALFSLALSTALVLIPVLPLRAASPATAPPKASAGGDATRPAHSVTAAGVLAAPSLTATKTDEVMPAPDVDGKAELGQTIKYTVTITNNGPDPANGVVFSDTVSANTTLVGGSVSTSPVATGESYSALGNVSITVPASAGLLANDCDPDNGGPCSNAGLTATGPATSDQGGNVVVNSNGGFTYNPRAGFEGADTFTYTVSDSSGLSDTATATINVNDVVWFVDNAAAAGGDGRLGSPYNGLAPLNNAATDPDETADVIFVHEGNAAYTGGIVLEDGQRLVGQGTSLDAALASFGITAPTYSDARPAATGNPTISNAGGDAVTLANSNVVSHVNANASLSGSAIWANGVNGAALVGVGASCGGAANGVSVVNVTGPVAMLNGPAVNSSVACVSSGAAVAVNGGAAGVTFTNTPVSQTGGRVVDIQNRVGANAVHFAGASTVTGTNGTTDAVSLANNSAGTGVTFDAPLHLSTNAPGARGIAAAGSSGMTLNVEASSASGSSTVNATGGAAVDIEGITVNVKFSTAFSTNSTGKGLRVETVSGTASFGNTTVSGSADTGVELKDDAATITFSDLDIAPASGKRALHVTGNTGAITSTSGVVATTGETAVEIDGGSGSTPLNVALTSVSANGGASGVVLRNTTASGSPGGFAVNGDGTSARNGSGGTVTSTTDDGVRLTNAAKVTLRSMNLTNNGDVASPLLSTNEGAAGEHAVEIVGGQSVRLSGVLVQNPKGSGLVALDLGGTNGIDGDSVFTDIDGLNTHAVYVVNTGVSLPLFEINDTEFTNSSSAASAVLFGNGGGASMTVEVENGCLFEALNSQAVTLVAGMSAGTTGTLTSSVVGNTFKNAVPYVSAGGANVTSENNLAALVANGATHNTQIEANTFDNVAEEGGLANLSIIRTQNAGGKMTAVVTGNTIQNIGFQLAAGGRHAIGHIFEPGVYNASNYSNLRIEGNTASNVTFTGTNREFVFIDYRAQASGGDIKILNNNWNMPTSGTQEAIELRFRQANASTVNLLVDNNGNGVGGAVHNTGVRFLDIDSEAAANVNATVTNNKFKNLNAATGSPMVDFASETGTASICVNVAGNSLTGNPAATNTIALNELAGTMNVTQSSTAAVSSSNNGATVSTTGSPAFGQPSCSLPMNASLTLPPVFTGAGVTAEVAAAATAGFSQNREFVSSLKTRGGFAYTERAQLLSAASVVGEVRPEAPRAASVAATSAATLSGENISIPVGTLAAGDSVTITFHVTVNNSVPAGTTQVSNQGTVSASNAASVLTDDPDAPGAADPTVTQLLLPPTIRVNDATAAEPASGSANMLFTVTLSHAYTHAVTVSYETANAGSATAGTDYTPTDGSVSFDPGQTVKTVSVPVKADGEAGEGNETFDLNLSNPVAGTISTPADGNATGTITDESIASAVIISELRTSGPGGAGDDFVELLNTTDQPVAIGGWSLVASGAACTDSPTVVAVMPAAATIPARGNYLLTGSAYSLTAYAAGDQALSADIASDSNVGLFSVGDLASIGSANRRDAVGFGANTADNCELLREGTNLPAVAGSTAEHSFVRKVTKGLTVDTTDNAADFTLVSAAAPAAINGTAPKLGAPGPEGTTSLRGPVPCSAAAGSALFTRALFDPSKTAADSPNVIRDTAAGTIEFRRTFTNNTGGIVSALRFRVVDLTTTPTEAGKADLRLLSSTASGGAQGTTLEAPSAPAPGGGVNSSVSVALPQPFEQGASVSLRFVFGVNEPGNYDVAFVLESTPGSGKDIWKLTGHTESGGHTDAGCNRPPVANAGPDKTAECSDGAASVTLNGSGSDPDGDAPLAYEWKEGATVLGSTQTLSVNLSTGAHNITLKVTDPSGDSATDSVTVTVNDTQAPVVDAPDNITAETGPGATSCGVTVGNLGTATADDACEGALTPTATRGDNQPLSAPYPVGTTTITWSATDSTNHTGQDYQTVTVVDNTKPTVTAPPDKTVANDPNSCSANVDPGEATASDNCGIDKITGTRSDNQPLDAAYPVGTTTITWTAKDIHGNTETATQTVTVNDTQPPSLISSVAVALLGSPFNHALINVGLSATASDNCGAVGPYQVSVYSDEDDGPAPHSPDATMIGVGTLRLRRERDGASDGRVYLVVVRVTDSSGNTSASCSTVGVPLSNSSAHVAAVNNQAASASGFCSAHGGAAPPGYFAVGP